ncbi:MAG: DUF3078 domain-containing protein [Saprospiraceae bacterium]|nr:DUF3078 domain-containing protein [Saprospiraceae bacterium]
MKKTTILLTVLLITAAAALPAQKVLDAKDNVKELSPKKDAKEGWTKIGGLGADFSWLNLINPRSGAGDNRVGFGGLLNYSANLVKDKLIWDNRLGLQLALVQVGNTALTKANDVLQFTSQAGYKIGSGKWYAAGLFDLQSQFLPTYGKNYLTATPKGVTKTLDLTGSLFSPATIRFAPGMIYKPSPNLTVLYSPVALKAIVVTNDKLAKTGNFFPLDATKPNKKADFQVGSEIRFDYVNKFFDGKVAYAGTLDLYSNYLRNPQNIDVEFYNSLDFFIVKNFSINFKSDWFYDHDIFVFKDNDVEKPTHRDVFIRNALLLKYSRAF